MSYGVFIASSSEGLTVAETVQALLLEGLNGLCEVHLWNQRFQLSRAYMESLEKELNEADFAVLVLTKDDELLFREAKESVPRDNVVFELGLFIGKLGRDRSFFIQPQYLKLPTDLLGIESVKFPVSADQDLRAALYPGCLKIAAAIREGVKNLPSRRKLTDRERAAQDESRRFYDQIEGAWWERIRLNGEVQALGFFTIQADEEHNSVRLSGEAYAKDGDLRAEWRSAGARLDNGKITYVRECRHYTSTIWLPGLGEADFDPPSSSGRIEKGRGKFWEGDETQPEKTIVKSVDLRRVRDENHKSIMREGFERDKEALVLNVLDKQTSTVF